ncbi:MAG TPA: phosphatidylglycerol lysyltransferase domain-containing protein [Geobacteraceae bacterium]
MEVPRYPASRPLDLSDKPLFDTLFEELQPRISEFTFANLYLFRAAHSYRLTLVGDAHVVMGSGYGGDSYFLPPLNGSIGEALHQLFGDGHSLYGADEPFVENYLRTEETEIVEDRDNFDYLYLRADMAELAGNRFHKKKNRVSYFTSRHSHEVLAYSSVHCQGCLQLLDDWWKVRSKSESRSLRLEAEATREALLLMDDLALEGLVILVSGRVKAFVFGERLNRDTSVCHFEKADPFLEGLSQLLDLEFNRRLFTDCTYVNREQDLGEPGLRNAKLSYHPVVMVRKFRARWQRQL